MKSNLKYLQLFEDRLESLKRLASLGLVDRGMQKLIHYMEGPMTGDLYLSRTGIKSLPNDLVIGGGLYLVDTDIQTLPDGLRVAGDLSLANTPIKELPADLQVGGDLYLYSTLIKTLPSDLQVGGQIIGFREE